MFPDHHEPELSFQRKAIEDFYSHSVALAQAPQPTENNQTRQVPPPTEAPTSSTPDSLAHAHTSANTEPTLQKKRSIAIITDNSDGDGTEKGSKRRMYSPILKPKFDF
jgi:hypothetical protein